MPSKNPKKVAFSIEPTEEEVISTVENNIKQLTSDTNEEVVKRIVCTFYKDGKHHDCFGCTQPTDKLDACKEAYIEVNKVKPSLVYNQSLEIPIERPKINVFSYKGTLSLGLNCDSCYISDKCPLFKPGNACAIDWGADIPSNPKDYLEAIIKIQTQRVRRAVMQEELDGGVADSVVSSEIDRLTGLVNTKADLDADKFSLRVDARSSDKQGGGILEKIFGSAIKQLPEGGKDA